MKNRPYSLYRHLNLINGKKYIGITSKTPEERWHSGYRHCPAMQRAINKYGWDSFEHSVLVTGLTREEAEKLETELIAKLNTRTPAGYNVEPGGKLNKEVPIGVREKISKTLRGRKASAETKLKMSEARQGRKHSEIHLARIIATTAKSVICLETQVIYQSVSDAARAIGVSTGMISRACNGRQSTSKGYHWRYYMEDIN